MPRGPSRSAASLDEWHTEAAATIAQCVASSSRRVDFSTRSPIRTKVVANMPWLLRRRARIWALWRRVVAMREEEERRVERAGLRMPSSRKFMSSSLLVASPDSWSSKGLDIVLLLVCGVLCCVFSGLVST